MKKIILLLVLAFAMKSISAQTDTTARLQISVITCSPGDELYSIFGHTAIRVLDSANQTDVIYNYGTFDFDDPNFLIKFTRGKLDYFLSTDEPARFFSSYQAEKRSITEQVLFLSNTEKRNIQDALIKNLSGNNKYYKYDFLFDNCTTRVRDILKKHTTISYTHQLVANGTTFRNMLYVYLDNGGMCWSKLGIDILLGSKIDKPVTVEQSSFLPDYLMFAVDSFNKKQYFISSRKDYPVKASIATGNKYQPLMVFSIIFLLMLFLSFSKTVALQKTYHYLSLFFVFVTGVMGCVLLFMWFATDHKSCSNNYNLLWALPTNLIFVFLANTKKLFVKQYYKTATIISVVLLVTWFILPQQFNISLMPFVFTMVLCYKDLFNKVILVSAK